ncbi:MAG: FAD synthetase family protein [Bacteroidales bacterium]|nr:FAD synthetase family protein [Bacteroidales bacterium]
MRIYYSLDLPIFRNPVVTVGAFDGVHLGHAQILQQTQSLAQKLGGESVVVTFNPHPQQVLHPEAHFQTIHSFEKNASLIAERGIDNLVAIPFTIEFSKMSYYDFLQKIVIDSIGAKVILMGPNHAFGNNREGSFEKAIELCSKLGVEVVKIPEFEMSASRVRSSQVRKYIREGKIKLAEEILGHSL